MSGKKKKKINKVSENNVFLWELTVFSSVTARKRPPSYWKLVLSGLTRSISIHCPWSRHSPWRYITKSQLNGVKLHILSVWKHKGGLPCHRKQGAGETYDQIGWMFDTVDKLSDCTEIQNVHWIYHWRSLVNCRQECFAFWAAVKKNQLVQRASSCAFLQLCLSHIYNDFESIHVSKGSFNSLLLHRAVHQ